MEIVGKFENKLVIKCDGGHYYEWDTYGTSSGCFFCEHEEGSTHFDYVEMNKIHVITNDKIIN